MTDYKIKGIEEIMLYHFDMDASEFFKMNLTDLKKVIDNNQINKSFQVFVLSDEKLQIGDQKKFKCSYKYSEKNHLSPIEKNKIRIVSWEGLENTNIKIDIPDSIKEVTLKIEGNNYGCMDEWGNKTFTDYTFFSGNKNLPLSSGDEKRVFKRAPSIESESSGNVKEKISYFLNSSGKRGSIAGGENFEDELSEIMETLK